MLLTTTQNLDQEFRVIDMVKGRTVVSKLQYRDKISEAVKDGGELAVYEFMMDDGEEIATQKMIDQAIAMDADAIIDILITTTTIGHAVDILVYGTAVQLV